MPTEETLNRRYEKEDREAVEQTIAALTQHRTGRKFLWWLLKIGHVGAQPFAKNALEMAFNCGSLNVGNRILAEITATVPAGYLQMMKESEDERRTRDNELDACGRDSADLFDRGAEG